MLLTGSQDAADSLDEYGTVFLSNQVLPFLRVLALSLIHISGLRSSQYSNRLPENKSFEAHYNSLENLGSSICHYFRGSAESG